MLVNNSLFKFFAKVIMACLALGLEISLNLWNASKSNSKILLKIMILNLIFCDTKLGKIWCAFDKKFDHLLKHRLLFEKCYCTQE